MENFLEHELFKKFKPKQLNIEGYTRLTKCYDESIVRIQSIVRQKVLKIDPINKKGQRATGINKSKWADINNNKKRSRSNKNTISTQVTPTILEAQEIQPNLQNEPTTQPNLQDELTKKRKRQTTVEEKNILDPICEGDSMPTDNKINNILTELNTISSNWTVNRVKTYYYNRKQKKRFNKNTISTQVTPTILEAQEIQPNLQNEPTTQPNLQDELTKKRKRQTTVEEKNILDPICEGDSMPTDNKINNILTELNTISSNWTVNRVKTYYYNRKQKKRL
ncbi:hypothetical protein Glove_214g51 [Diversispora epigaea]|uniref:Uncharacterized protein n=1 Tax=Diversispora epigaea TaxID=1348612 RepID=A0A397IKP9_9GLOM|nr:hypothetical protein Glove_214g51 [Diversispora epigaea]